MKSDFWNEEAEQKVLGNIFLYNCFKETLGIIEPDDFYKPHHKAVYRAMLELYDEGLPIDEVLIKEKLRETGYKGINWLTFLIKLTGKAEYKERTIYYAQVIKRDSIKRKVQKRIQMLSQESESEKIEEHLNSMILEIQEVPTMTNAFINLGDVLNEIVEDIEKRREGEIKIKYPSGWINFDKFIEIKDQHYYIIAGRPSVGKSTYALNLAMNFVKNEIPVLFLSFEMSHIELAYKILASQLRMDNKKLEKVKLSDEEYEKVKEERDILKHFHFKILRNPEIDIQEIEKKMSQFLNEHKMGVLFLDYLQLTEIKDGKENREQKVALISRNLKKIAMKYNIPVIAISQLSRRIEQRGKKAKPLLSDLRESGAIEQDADVVIFLYQERDKMYKSKQEPIDIFVAKNRNGAIGRFKMLFHKAYSRFDNYIGEQELPW